MITRDASDTDFTGRVLVRVVVVMVGVMVVVVGMMVFLILVVVDVTVVMVVVMMVVVVVVMVVLEAIKNKRVHIFFKVYICTYSTVVVTFFESTHY